MKIKALKELRGLEEGDYKASINFEEGDLGDFITFKQAIGVGKTPEMKLPDEKGEKDFRQTVLDKLALLDTVEENIAEARLYIRDIRACLMTVLDGEQDPARFAGEIPENGEKEEEAHG